MLDHKKNYDDLECIESGSVTGCKANNVAGSSPSSRREFPIRATDLPTQKILLLMPDPSM
jgi:hypothetical protein